MGSGIGIGSSLRESCGCVPSPPQQSTNPDPEKFKIVKIAGVSHFTLAKVKYENCTNYEGEKIILFALNIRFVKAMSRIDPHFSEDSSITARFVPTQGGWDLGIETMHILQRAYDSRQRQRKASRG